MYRRALVLLLLAAAGGCRIHGNQSTGVIGSGQAKTETRQVADFERLRVDGSGTVVATLGQPPSLTITTDDNLLPLLESTVVDGCLTIRPTRSVSPRTPIRIELTCPDLTSYASTGAVKLELRNVDNAKLHIELSGAGEVSANGTTERLEIVVSGAGSLDTTALQARTVDIQARGAVKLKVAAGEKITGSLAGACSLTYTGDPQVKIESDISCSIRRVAD